MVSTSYEPVKCPVLYTPVDEEINNFVRFEIHSEFPNILARSPEYSVIERFNEMNNLLDFLISDISI